MQQATGASLLVAVSNDLAAVSAAVLRSLVQVRSGERGVGAGIAWPTAGFTGERTGELTGGLTGRLILTNAHVVGGREDRRPMRRAGQAGAAGLTVVLPDGRTLPAQVVARDEARDLAALRVDPQDLAGYDLPAVQLGDSHTLQPGDVVLALGFPWGVTGGATSGVVIGVGDALPEGPGQETRREWIAASLHLRPGHSGGPMVDARGRLVGINTLMNGPDVGVAIPVHVAEAFLAAHGAAQVTATAGETPQPWL